MIKLIGGLVLSALVTKRQRHLLNQLPIPPWRHGAYFIKRLAKPWQLFTFVAIMASIELLTMIGLVSVIIAITYLKFGGN